MKLKLLLIILLVNGLTSCSMVSANILRMFAPARIPAEVRQSTITLHSLDNTKFKSRLVTNVSANNRQVIINKIPVLSNRDIAHCEPFEYKKGQYGLKFRLTTKGKMQWQQSCAEFRGMKGAMALGGQFKCFFLFSEDFRGPYYKIAASLSKKEAEEISHTVIHNYEVIKNS